MAEIKGIDISRWQGPSFSLAQAKAKGARFAIARIMTGEFPGDGKDSQSENYYKQAKECGLPIGFYVFGNATTVQQAKAEAREAMRYLADKTPEYPIFYDVESKAMLGCNKRLLTDIIKAFCQELESGGYWVGIYSSTSFFDDLMYDSELSAYSHWVADWRGKKPVLKSGNEVQIWQTGSEKNYQGSIEVDQNICYVDYFEEKIKAAGLNNWPKQDVTITDELELELAAISAAVNNIKKIIERSKK